VRVVFDTCVVVSGLLGSKPVELLFDAVIDGKLVPIWDQRLFVEYREMPLRPKFNGRVSAARMEQIIQDLTDFGEFVDGSMTRLPVPARDVKDTAILELAVAGGVHALVTYNVKDFPPAGTYGFDYPLPWAMVHRLKP
jgi:putative PIN family toxin of toxin-antitoxin system